MTEDDKQRLKDAFLSAIEQSPAADEPIDGMTDGKGGRMTLRTLFMATMEQDSFYADIDRDVQKGLTSVERVAEQIRNTRRISLQP